VAQNEDQGNPFLQLTKLLLFAALAGIFVAFITLPAVGSAGLTARNAADNFQSMDAELNTTPPPEKTVVYDSDGKQLALFFDKYRESVRLDQIAPIMQQAVVAIEDSRFYKHGALDLKGTLRALMANVESNQVSQGGSTLTQQYVKNLLAESAKNDEEYKAVTAPTVGRKLRELRYALEIEKKMEKAQILEGYLNIAYFGGGAYGVQAGAKRWFSKPADKLNLGEAAMLAGITQNPAAYDPIVYPEKAHQRRDTVLNRMAELGMISKERAKEATAKPIDLNETKFKGGCETSKAPYFCMYMQFEMYNILADGKYFKLSDDRKAEIHNRLKRGGYIIRTTLDRKAQRAAEQALRTYVRPTDQQVAAEAMIQPGTGKIRAMAASKRFGTNKKAGETTINVVANAAHGGGAGFQAGSTFKAFTLATAFKQGMDADDTLRAPSPFVPASGFTNCKGKPANDASHRVFNSSRESGKGNSYSLRTGTWKSVNTFFMALERQVGLCETIETARSMGITQRADGSPLQEFSTFTLGVNEMDPVTVAAAFATFAARGKYCKPVAITEVVDPNGKKLKVPGADCKQAVSEGVADGVNGILQGVFTRGTMTPVGGIGRPAAGKTGTNDNYSSAWFAGYTPDLAAAVSVGDPRGPARYPLTGSGSCLGGRCYGNVYGASIPGPVWKRSMIGALAGTRPTPFRVAPDYGTIRVPDVRGRSVGVAISTLRAAGLDVEVSDQPVPSDHPAGTVENTSPGPGSEIEPRTKVIIFLSNGMKRRGPENDEDDGGGFPWPFD
jgi:membrane peptidoglycan carboxypeptidase